MMENTPTDSVTPILPYVGLASRMLLFLPFPLLHLDSDGCICGLNSQAKLLLEISTLTEIVGKPLCDFLEPREKGSFNLALQFFGDHRISAVLDVNICIQGTKRRIRITLIKGEYCDVLVILEPSEAVSDAILLQCLFQSDHGICLTDEKGIILRANKTFCSFLGYVPHELVGKKIFALRSREIKCCYSNMLHILKCNKSWGGEITARHKCGDMRTMWVTIDTFDFAGSQRPLYFVKSFDFCHISEAMVDGDWYGDHVSR